LVLARRCARKDKWSGQIANSKGAQSKTAGPATKGGCWKNSASEALFEPIRAAPRPATGAKQKNASCRFDYEASNRKREAASNRLRSHVFVGAYFFLACFAAQPCFQKKPNSRYTTHPFNKAVCTVTKIFFFRRNFCRWCAAVVR
jgi:hypothetical protein